MMSQRDDPQDKEDLINKLQVNLFPFKIIQEMINKFKINTPKSSPHKT